MQRLKETSTAQELVTISLSGLVSRANGGDLAALARLREYLVENPDMWQKLGDLAWHRHENLLRTIGGTGDQAALLSESVRLKADELRTSLLPRYPQPVHRLAVERVVLSYLELHDLDAKQPTLTNDNAKLAVAYQRARDAAQRRYLAALKTLAALVKLLPAETSRPKLTRPRLGRPAVLKLDSE